MVMSPEYWPEPPPDEGELAGDEGAALDEAGAGAGAGAEDGSGAGAGVGAG